MRSIALILNSLCNLIVDWFIFNSVSFLQNTHNRPLARAAFCKLSVWYVFCYCHCSTVYDLMIYDQVIAAHDCSHIEVIYALPDYCLRSSCYVFRLTVNKAGPNQGRPFFGCQKPMGQGCGFFQWGDEDGGGGGGGGGFGGGGLGGGGGGFGGGGGGYGGGFSSSQSSSRWEQRVKPNGWQAIVCTHDYPFLRRICASPGPVFCLLVRVSSDCVRPITGQVTSVTWPVIGWA